MSDNDETLRKLGGCVATWALLFLAFAISFAGIALSAEVLIQLWGWFALPYGLPSLSLVGAVGLVLITSLLCGQESKQSVDKEGKPEETVAGVAKLALVAIVRPVFFLAAGYLAHTWFS